MQKRNEINSMHACAYMSDHVCIALSQASCGALSAALAEQGRLSKSVQPIFFQLFTLLRKY
jgi:hypothetical protein